ELSRLDEHARGRAIAQLDLHACPRRIVGPHDGVPRDDARRFQVASDRAPSGSDRRLAARRHDRRGDPSLSRNVDGDGHAQHAGRVASAIARTTAFFEQAQSESQKSHFCILSPVSGAMGVASSRFASPAASYLGQAIAPPLGSPAFAKRDQSSSIASERASSSAVGEPLARSRSVPRTKSISLPWNAPRPSARAYDGTVVNWYKY